MTISRFGIKLTSQHRSATSTTSKGDQLKWRIGDWWVKANTKGYKDWAEKVVSDLLALSNVPVGGFVRYELVTIIETDTGRRYEGCASKNFLAEGEWFITLDRLLTRSGVRVDDLLDLPFNEKVKATLSYSERITGLPMSDYMAKMLTLDAFILNEDRHLNNIGFIRRANGSYAFSPFFDQGLSLLSDVEDYTWDTSLEDNMISVRAKPFSPSFRKQVQAFKGGIRFRKQPLLSYINSLPSEASRIQKVLKIQAEKYKDWLVE